MYGPGDRLRRSPAPRGRSLDEAAPDLAGTTVHHVVEVQAQLVADDHRDLAPPGPHREVLVDGHRRLGVDPQRRVDGAGVVFDPQPVAPVHRHPVVIDQGLDVIARCEPGAQRTRVGRLSYDRTAELDRPEALKDDQDPAFTAALRKSLVARMPVYRDQADLGGHASWITLTPDERPIVGPVEAVPGLWVVAGFSGNDFQLAPSIGEGLAQMILGEPVSAFDVDFLSPKRFQ